MWQTNRLSADRPEAVTSRLQHAAGGHVVGQRLCRGGIATLYTVLAMAVLVPVLALAVDYGHTEMVRMELRAACDSVARYAATGITDNTTLTKANALGAQNPVDGKPLVFQAGDIEVGVWNPTTRVFTPSTNTPNALRLTGRRTQARGNAVSLTVGPLIGMNSVDLAVTTTVAFSGIPNFAAIGLSELSLGGSSSLQDSRSVKRAGNVGSNSDITIGGSTIVPGDARPGVGKQVLGSVGNVAGSTAPLNAPLVYPVVQAGSAATTNNNSNISPSKRSGAGLSLGNNDTQSVPGGTYYFDDIKMNGNGELNFTGDATIYCYGSVSINGTSSITATPPYRVKLILCPAPDGSAPGDLQILGNGKVQGTIYAPLSDISVTGSGEVYGAVLGKSLSLNGNAALFYDDAVAGGTSGGAVGTLSIVQ